MFPHSPGACSSSTFRPPSNGHVDRAGKVLVDRRPGGRPTEQSAEWTRAVQVLAFQYNPDVAVASAKCLSTSSLNRCPEVKFLWPTWETAHGPRIVPPNGRCDRIIRLSESEEREVLYGGFEKRAADVLAR